MLAKILGKDGRNLTSKVKEEFIRVRECCLNVVRDVAAVELIEGHVETEREL